MPFKKAKGPLYARQLLCAMYNGESYFMMVDAHSTFCDHWDTLLKQEYRHLKYHCGVPRPIISAYSALTEQQQKDGVVHHLCSASPVTNGKLYPGRTESVPIVKSATYKLTAYLSCHYTFASGALCEVFARALAFKGFLFKHVFWGEEALLACVAYTHGYDVYTPPAVHLLHAYAQNHPPTPSWRSAVAAPSRSKQQREDSEQAMQCLLDPFATIAQPQLRSVRDFWVAAGFVFDNGTPLPVQSNALCT